MPALADLVAAAHAAFPVDRSLSLITELAALDRFQASRGIEAAADRVAERAERAGLRDVQLVRFPTDAGWWSFRPPAPWTPHRARLDLLGPAAVRPMVRFPELACSLATHSAPARLPDAPLVDAGARPPAAELAGAVVLLSRRDAEAGPPVPLVVERLTAAGAAGVVTDLAAPADPRGAGRVELPRDARLFCFSVPSAVFAELAAAARAGARARVEVEVERAGRMPLVHGVLPGSGDAAPILVQAHLCHPRPSANDNASGVAAAVGIAETLTALGAGRRRRPVAVLWAPALAGTAGELHAVVGLGVARGGTAAPALAVNLDMVGEDQAQCGGPLVVEGPPAHRPSVLPALFADALEALPAAARSYSTAVPLRTWNWTGTPFSGGSDHAVLADPSVGASAVCLGHWPDRFRHSSLDTVDRVDPQELRRVGAATAAVVQFAGCAGPGDLAEMGLSVARWASAQLTTIARAATAEARDGSVDPFEPAWSGSFLAHQVRSADRAARHAAALIGAAPAPRQPYHDWLTAQARALAGPRGAGDEATPARRPAGAPVLRRAWAGPFNVEGLIAAALPPDRAWLLTEDHRRPAAYTEMLALALAVDDMSTLDDVVTRAAYSTWLALDLAFAREYVRVLVDTGWVTLTRRTDGGR